MLHRALILSIAILGGGCLQAQVVVDVPIVLSGDGPARVVLGVAPGETLNAGVSVEAAVLGYAHWTTITLDGDTLVMTTVPAENVDRSGLLLRGVLPVLPTTILHARLQGLTSRPLVHRDGTPVHGAELRQGGIVELLTDQEFHLLTSAGRSPCPPGSVPLNGTTCVDRGVNSTNATFYEAATACAERGGRLCAWDEYIAACNVLASTLEGLFNDWEWINDTSNHTHTVDQAGRTTCMSQRSASPNTLGATRCCYRAR